MKLVLQLGHHLKTRVYPGEVDVEIWAGPTAGVAGTRKSGTVPGSDGGEGALRNGDGGVDIPLGGKARGGMGAS
jgi:hypothetical protein